MGYVLFLILFTIAITAGALAILDRMGFPHLVTLTAKMIVILVAGLTILLSLRAWG